MCQMVGVESWILCYFHRSNDEINWAVLSDEQMSNGWSYPLLNDEQMSNKVRVEHQPVKCAKTFVFFW